MSREFVNELPEAFRDLYGKALVNPKAGKVFFEERQRTEDTKARLRETSKIYQIFGENMFMFTTADGALNTEIRLLNVQELNKDIENEILLTKYRQATLKHLPKSEPVKTELVKDKETFISFTTDEIIEDLSKTNDSLHEARNRLRNINGIGRSSVFYDKPNDFTYFSFNDTQIYLNQEDRKDVIGIQKMLQDIQNTQISMTNFMYMKHAIKAKALFKSIAQINWKYESRVNPS